MNTEELQELIAQEAAGAVRIGVDRTVARRFFTEASLARIHERTGDSPTAQKIFVLSLWAVSAASLVASLIMSFMAFSWWAIAAAVICPVVFFGFMSASSSGRAGQLGISIVLIASLAVVVIAALPQKAAYFILLFVLSLWCIRLVYVSSTKFYRMYALRSPQHFELLAPGIDVRSSASPE
jgi:hypothetical protein